MQRKGLGRGLQALLPEVTESDTVTSLPLRDIEPNRFQPRKHFDPEKLSELVESIREHGVVQPVIVRTTGRGYELVAGERRWRAAQMAGLETIPAVVREYTDGETMEIALVENLQREDLNPMEEAAAYRKLMEEFGLTQEMLGIRIGKSRPQIANTLRLLNLPARIQALISEGRLSMGHAKVLLGLEDEALQEKAAREIVGHDLSVRAAEQLAEKWRRGGRSARAGRRSPDSAIASLEEELRMALGTRVTIRPISKNKGRIEIEYYSHEDLQRILEVITGAEGAKEVAGTA